MVETTSRSFRLHDKSVFLLFLFLFLVENTAQVSATNRCDYKKDVTYWTYCRECSITKYFPCPSSYVQTSGPNGTRSCKTWIYFGSGFGSVSVQGCQHTCVKKEVFKKCCDGFWGSECEACPGNPVCNNAGKCSDGLSGSGVCSCQDGFKGTACEYCTNTTMCGPDCNQTCTCKHGVCDNIVDSPGHCKPYSCHIGYTGHNCDIRLPACHGNLSCVKHADCYHVNGSDTCICEPGYTGDAKTRCTAINPCAGNSSHHGCHSDAVCHYLKPGRHTCECKQGYRGDGTVCMVINPCSNNSGGCHTNTSSCNFLAPGKSDCSCFHGFTNFTSGKGCSMIDMCNDGNHGNCDVNADCMMVKPGEKRCICKKGYRGNGTVCYGNILKRIQQLHTAGPPGVYGQLAYANNIFKVPTLARAMSDTGPFTAFVPTDAAIMSLSFEQRMKLVRNVDFTAHLVRMHLAAADLDSFALRKLVKVTSLQGKNATVTENNGTLYCSFVGSQIKAKIIASDFIAGNGIIHVIDKVLWHSDNFTSTDNYTVLQIIERRLEFSQFTSWMQLTGLDNYVQDLTGPITFFVPDNSALQLNQLTSDYLTKTDKGKEKLRSIIKTHLITNKVDVTNLISLSRIGPSNQGEYHIVRRNNTGAIIIGEKSVITESNIKAYNGLVHKVNNVLIPQSAQPLVPNFMYRNKTATSLSICYHCDIMQSFPNKGCRKDFIPSGGFEPCRYRVTSFIHGGWSFTGCRTKNCIKVTKVAECSSGYYGSDCRPCTGPLEKPCSLHGKCNDGLLGNGVCKCDPLFTGSACENCKEANMFGPDCNTTCTCVHGACDNGVHGNGTCKPSTCQSGYHGNNCDLTDKSCIGSPSIHCHYKAHCVSENGQDVCKCNAGYEGTGLVCDEINPCMIPNHGGCHKDAACIKTGPGTNNCTCDRGFHGDGLVCTAINPCDGHSCHSNAECIFTGPGQSICKCKPGFTGDGRSCSEINPCLADNGGCSNKAKCVRTGPGNHTCSCNHGYIGNGYSCLGSVTAILHEDSRFSKVYDYVKIAHMEYYFSMEAMNFTVFAPSTKAFNQFTQDDIQYWSGTNERLKHLIKNHVVNITTFKKDFVNNSALVAVNGQTINITITDTITLNGRSNVITPDIVGANGVIHLIDKVLVPRRIQETNLPTVAEALNGVTELSKFYSYLLKQTDVKTKLDTCYKGCTVFAPVNDALEHQNLTSRSLKYHVVTKYILPGHFFNGQEVPTLLSPYNYNVKLTKPSVGKFEVNGIFFYSTPIKTKHVIIYKLAGVLTVPKKRRCDFATMHTGVTLCRSCFFSNNCPSGWTILRRQSCIFWFIFSGCQAVCRKVEVTKKCCSGFWGQDCQACPGNMTHPCSGNGKCQDGISGSGHCSCSTNFTGTACEKCLPNKYGRTCSSSCNCVNGRCNAGLHGDGSCTCYNGWDGDKCQIRADPVKCRPKMCSFRATCRNTSGRFDCDCDAGYTGNGTHCRAIHVCDSNNGGCHRNALCIPNPTDPSLASCICKPRYTGDGQFCSAIDRCQINNGGCHVNATCTNIGPSMRNCFCHDGYHGDGLVCRPENPCTENNGGCSYRASCKRTGPGQRECTCDPGYYGDGETCMGNSMEVLKSDPELSQMNNLYKRYHIDELLQSDCQANIMAPTNKALQKILNKHRRKRRSLSSTTTIEQYLRYHIIGCVRFNNYTMRNGGKFVSLLGAPVWIRRNSSNSSKAVFMDAQNNTANIVQILESENGFVFKLDAVLSPPMEYVQKGDPNKPFAKVASELGFTTVVNLMKIAGLQDIVSNPYGRPYLVFISTNQAIDKLPSDLKARLTNPANADELAMYVKYHVVHNAPANLSTDVFLRSGGGVQFRTMQGQYVFISCKGDKGDLYVNGISRISKRDIRFLGGVAFAVDDVMVPLGFGGKCDEIVHEKTTGECSNCLSTEGCPHDTTLVGTTNLNCSYGGGFLGCQHVCMKRKLVRKCCQNFYSSDCRACPGGVGTPCSGRGQCDDGLTGTGRCNCSMGYHGYRCERCPSNVTCPAPNSCLDNNGGCHVFATCSNDGLKCTCRPGYEGDGYYCQMRDPCTLNNGGCGSNATCHFKGPDQRQCLCKQGFYQVGDTCKAFVTSSPCAVNHGGCSDHGYCREINGSASCSCWGSYYGDGRSCHGNIIQTLQDTVKVQAFYKALYHLRQDVQGQALLSSLQTDSKYFTVFAPADSAMSIKDFNLTVIKNHILPGRIQLSTINDVFRANNLLGSKIMIRKLKNGLFTINGAGHVLADIKAVNGLIYIVDQTIPIIGQIPGTPSPPPMTGSTTTTPLTAAKPSSLSSPSSSTTTSSTTTTTKESSTISTSESTSSLPLTTKESNIASTSELVTSTGPSSLLTSQSSSTSPTSQAIPSAKSAPSSTATSSTQKKNAVFARQRKDKGINGGTVTGIVCAIIFIVVAVAVFIWYIRKRHLTNPGFRYQKENDTVQYDSDVFHDSTTPSIAFNNPIYDNSEPGPSEIEVHVDKGFSEPFQDHTDFYNPLYLELREQPSPPSPQDGPKDDVLAFNDELREQPSPPSPEDGPKDDVLAFNDELREQPSPPSPEDGPKDDVLAFNDDVKPGEDEC